MGFALVGLIMVNIIYFIFALISTDLINNWSIAFKQETFEINEQFEVLKLWKSDANKLMISIFSVTLYMENRKIKLINIGKL